jgi:hypothetical protein
VHIWLLIRTGSLDLNLGAIGGSTAGYLLKYCYEDEAKLCKSHVFPDMISVIGRSVFLLDPLAFPTRLAEMKFQGED